MYAEHLTSVGRRSAIERVAHFLLELQARFEVIGLTDGNSYPMPLTQELISDALGLSVPHVNRTLRQLREDGLLAIEGHRVVLSDRDALCALADFERGYFDNFRAPEFSLNENTAGASAIAADQPQLAAENDRDPLDWRSEPVGLGPRSDRAT